MQFRSPISLVLAIFLLALNANVSSGLASLISGEAPVIVHKYCPIKIKKETGISRNFETGVQTPPAVREVLCASPFKLETNNWFVSAEENNFKKHFYRKSLFGSAPPEPGYPPPKSATAIAS